MIQWSFTMSVDRLSIIYRSKGHGDGLGLAYLKNIIISKQKQFDTCAFTDSLSVITPIHYKQNKNCKLHRKYSLCILSQQSNPNNSIHCIKLTFMVIWGTYLHRLDTDPTFDSLSNLPEVTEESWSRDNHGRCGDSL